MKNQIQQWKTLLKGKTLAAVLMLALTASFGGYEFLKPAPASAASVAPAAAALDDNSISALTALDHAMETLAAHVTPAVVNVTGMEGMISRTARRRRAVLRCWSLVAEYRRATPLRPEGATVRA